MGLRVIFGLKLGFLFPPYPLNPNFTYIKYIFLFFHKLLIEKGVRANVVAPGPFWTVLQPSGGQPREKVTKFGEQSQFGRPGQPVEIAPVYVLLASQEGSYITGEVFGVTGGAGIA